MSNSSIHSCHQKHQIEYGTLVKHHIKYNSFSVRQHTEYSSHFEKWPLCFDWYCHIRIDIIRFLIHTNTYLVTKMMMIVRQLEADIVGS